MPRDFPWMLVALTLVVFVCVSGPAAYNIAETPEMTHAQMLRELWWVYLIGVAAGLGAVWLVKREQ